MAKAIPRAATNTQASDTATIDSDAPEGMGIDSPTIPVEPPPAPVRVRTPEQIHRIAELEAQLKSLPDAKREKAEVDAMFERAGEKAGEVNRQILADQEESFLLLNAARERKAEMDSNTRRRQELQRELDLLK